MTGYTTRFSVDTIKDWIEKGYFDDSSPKGDLIQAINELDVHFRYGNIGKTEYECLRETLQRKVAKEENKYEKGTIPENET